ncbi:MAG: hypothetical protein UX13_C0012G0006 [Candidatus Woesebacteria bacterium GW2011_GWB1_45_5]|uniref:DUF5667 domain-containing protein n=1 Tax=Candidatus Woesebacteria bacterium GW2011_GWB1_45_5 TaxID=1618581 RepID=A0A0G1MQM1_9BACT|nr:MAG: hypothetical protein UX13_C0012G0006 [Candidatus Woesebacteria bacterium GW2011_GWB1_45_5]
MIRKILLSLASFVFAFAILSVSVLESASVSYVFATPLPQNLLGAQVSEVDYQVPYPGKISPDHFLWGFKAMRDKIQYMFTRNPLKKAELALLFSDKRLVLSKTLFENKKPDIALSTLTKAEKYLEIAVIDESVARSEGHDTLEFLTKLATASLKHRQTIAEILLLAPEDAKPDIVKTEDYPKNAFKAARDVLNSKGIVAPKDPFDGE